MRINQVNNATKQPKEKKKREKKMREKEESAVQIPLKEEGKKKWKFQARTFDVLFTS